MRPQMRVSRAAVLALVLLALFMSACGRAPLEVSPISWPKQTPIEMRVGDTVNITGFVPEAVEIKDESLLRFRPGDDSATGATPVATYVAVARGNTEIVVTQSMCLTITANCGDAAFYYILTVQVH